MTVLAHVIPMIRGKDNDRVVRQTIGFQGIQDATGLSVGKSDGRIVGLDDLPSSLVGEVDLLLLSTNRFQSGFRNRLLVAFRHFGNLDGLEWIHLEILLRRHEGSVRTKQSHRKIEGHPILGALLELLDRIGRGDAIGLLLIGPLSREPAQGPAKLPGSQGLDDRLIGDIAPSRIDRLVPGIGVVVTTCADVLGHVVMIDFPDPGREIAVVTKDLGDGLHLGKGFPNVDGVGVDQGLIRIEPRHERSPTGTTERILAMRIVKANPALGETIDIWGLHLGMTIQPHVAVQIVTDQEKDVGLLILGLSLSRGGAEQENQRKKVRVESSEIHGPGICHGSPRSPMADLRSWDFPTSGHLLPVEPELGEVFADPVAIVGYLSPFPGSREEDAACFGLGAGFSTDGNDFGQLHPVEAIDLLQLILRKHTRENFHHLSGFTPRSTPESLEACDLFVDELSMDPPISRKGRQPGDGTVEVPEIPRPRTGRILRKFHEGFVGFLVEAHTLPHGLRDLFQFVGNVRLDVLPPVLEPGQLEEPEIETGKKIRAKGSRSDLVDEILVRPRDELEITRHLSICSDRIESLLLDRP